MCAESTLQIRRAKPDWRCALNLSASNLKDKMLSARRIVVLAYPVGEMLCPFVEDVEDEVASRYRTIDRDNDRAPAHEPVAGAWPTKASTAQRWRTTGRACRPAMCASDARSSSALRSLDSVCSMVSPAAC